HGIRYGVEFQGGTQLILRFTNTPQIDRIRSVVDQTTRGAVIQTYDDPKKNQVLVRLPSGEGEGAELSAQAQTVVAGLARDYAVTLVTQSSTQSLGPVAAQELRRHA